MSIHAHFFDQANRNPKTIPQPQHPDASIAIRVEVELLGKEIQFQGWQKGTASTVLYFMTWSLLIDDY